jgi:hypothetical protein
MIGRCYKPYYASYKYYGALGIRVCERWHSYDNFVADMGLRPEGMTLERIDSTGHYEPGNCIWATPTAQNRNRRDNVILTHNGRSLCVSEWAEELGIAREAIYSRLRYGYPIEQVLYQGNLRGKR